MAHPAGARVDATGTQGRRLARPVQPTASPGPGREPAPPRRPAGTPGRAGRPSRAARPAPPPGHRRRRGGGGGVWGSGSVVLLPGDRPAQAATTTGLPVPAARFKSGRRRRRRPAADPDPDPAAVAAKAFEQWKARITAPTVESPVLRKAWEEARQAQFAGRSAPDPAVKSRLDALRNNLQALERDLSTVNAAGAAGADRGAGGAVRQGRQGGGRGRLRLRPAAPAVARVARRSTTSWLKRQADGRRAEELVKAAGPSAGRGTTGRRLNKLDEALAIGSGRRRGQGDEEADRRRRGGGAGRREGGGRRRAVTCPACWAGSAI